MRLRIPLVLVGILLLGGVVDAQDKKEKKVSFYYPEAFLAAKGVDPQTGLFSDAQETFNVIRDESVTIWLSLKFITNESRNVKFVWYSPRGEKYTESKPMTLNKEEYNRQYARVWQQIGIRDLDKLGLLGQWRVVAMVNDKPIDKEARFTLAR